MIAKCFVSYRRHKVLSIFNILHEVESHIKNSTQKGENLQLLDWQVSVSHPLSYNYIISGFVAWVRSSPVGLFSAVLRSL